MRDVLDQRVDRADVLDRQDVVDRHAEPAPEWLALADVDLQVRVLLNPVDIGRGVPAVGIDDRVDRPRRLGEAAALVPVQRQVDHQHDRENACDPADVTAPFGQNSVGHDEKREETAGQDQPRRAPCVGEVGGHHERGDPRGRLAQAAHRDVEEPERERHQDEEPEEDALLVTEHRVGPDGVMANGAEEQQPLDRLERLGRDERPEQGADRRARGQEHVRKHERGQEVGERPRLGKGVAQLASVHLPDEHAEDHAAEDDVEALGQGSLRPRPRHAGAPLGHRSDQNHHEQQVGRVDMKAADPVEERDLGRDRARLRPDGVAELLDRERGHQ